MKNIIYIVYNLVNAGPENVLYDICANLNRKKYNPIIIVLRKQILGVSIEHKFQQLGIEIYHFDFSTLELQFFYNRVARKIKKILPGLDEYVVHAHGFHPALIASNLKCKSICTVHCISGEDFVMSNGKVLGTYMSWKLDKILKKIDYPVAISNFMADYYHYRIEKQIYRIYNGVGAKKLKEDSKTLRTKLKIPHNAYVVIIVGVLSERKNNLLIIEQLKKSQANFLCLIIGDGPQMNDCLKLAEDDARFRFEGFRSNIIEYQSVADLCISSALSEGLPLSVLEAINVGVPMLMSDIPPHKEIENAVSLDSVKTFSLEHCNLLDRFIQMKACCFDRKELAERACQLFGAKTMAIEYEKLYQQAYQKNN